MALTDRPLRGPARFHSGAMALLALAPAACGICLPLPSPQMHVLD